MKMSQEEFNSLFDRIDNGFVGSEDHVFSYQSYYTKYFVNPKRKLVLDFGCGQGAFLKALRRLQINSLGLDINPVNIETCQQKGYSAELCDGRKYITDHAGEFDGIFLAHVIEHYDGQSAVRFLVEIFESLMPGGRLVIITPNFLDPEVALNRFWLSTSHVRPYPLMWLQNALTTIGFSIIDGGADPKYNDTFIVAEKPKKIKE